MKLYNWNDITVYQWQQLNSFESSDDIETTIIAAAIITGKTEAQIRKMTLEELQGLKQQVAFMSTEIPLQRVDYITTSSHKYKTNYDIKNMDTARYIEAKHFASDFVGNLHKLAACLITPLEVGILKDTELPYDASKHEEYSNDLLTAKITDVLGSVVFFYLVYQIWIRTFKDYLIEQMMNLGMTRTQGEMIHQALCDNLVGFIKQQSSRNMKGFHLSKYIA